jgi:hypothetical protein
MMQNCHKVGEVNGSPTRHGPELLILTARTVTIDRGEELIGLGQLRGNTCGNFQRVGGETIEVARRGKFGRTDRVDRQLTVFDCTCG